MDVELRTCFDRYNFPEYIFLLFELYGIDCVANLLKTEETLVEDIENSVRSGNFDNFVDFSNKNNREKYLGSDVIYLSNYRIKEYHRKRLILACSEVKKQYSEQKVITEVTWLPSGSSSSSRIKRVKVELEDSHEESNSFKKLLKYEGNNKSAYNAIISKLTSLCKEFLETANCEGEFTENDIKLSFDTDKNIYKGSIRCLICSSYFAICYRKDSISIPSYKKHFQNHLSNPEDSKQIKMSKFLQNDEGLNLYIQRKFKML